MNKSILAGRAVAKESVVVPVPLVVEEPVAAQAPARPGGREEAHLLASEIHPDHGWMKWLDKNGADLRDGLCVGKGYEMRVPAGLEATVSVLVDGEFPVYAAAIKSGMRFPPHPFVVEVLDGFNIAVAQLTPNPGQTYLAILPNVR